MDISTLILLALITSVVCFSLSKKRYASGKSKGLQYQTQAIYYSWHTVMWCAVPAIVILIVWIWAENHILAYLINASSSGDMDPKILISQILMVKNHIITPSSPEIITLVEAYTNLENTSRMALAVLFLTMLAGGAAWGLSRVRSTFNAQRRIEKILERTLLTFSAIAVMVTLGIVLSVLFESLRFFQLVSPAEFFFGDIWSPQTAIRQDQVASSGTFGAIPLFAGTFLITGIAMLIAVPTGLMSALYLSEFAPKRIRSTVKPLLEILAGIPTVVYGFFAVLAIAPFIRQIGTNFGLDVSSESALAAGLTMGVMIIPFVSSLSDDAINAVPQSLREGSYGLGATQTETIIQVILPAALPGIVSSILLAVSRAIGETMIVVMAAGLAANLTINPLESVTTVTVQIVALLTGDQEFDSAKTLAAFALGLTLFFITLILNIVALLTTRKYHEKYD